jgi:hypothetical protein
LIESRIAMRPPSIRMKATISARWTGTQIWLSATTLAVAAGSAGPAVTGWMRFPTNPRTAPAIAAQPPILNTHRSSLAESEIGVATSNVPSVVAAVALLVASRR